ncbi:MAG TPA: PEPxxWA-CTERM sorting domain-containing protein [Caulobacteraceae bacterium]|jgi:hypothetical protein|nr:PEPxxWA-CTERM sorting domain-containing protein [Caulobacteraceae bacterium]
MNSAKLFAATAAAVTAGLLAASANATTLTGLYNTGVDNGGTVLGGDVADTHWAFSSVTGTATGTTAYASLNNSAFPAGYWVLDNSTSRWITPTQNAGDSFDPSADGLYDYTLTFNVANVGKASFAGQYAVDNQVTSILLNGVALNTNGGGTDGSFTGFAAPTGSGFVSGANTLTFVVDNFAQNGGNPSGLNVEFTSSAGGVPEPATWAMMLVGFGGLGAAIRSRRGRVATAA